MKKHIIIIEDEPDLLEILESRISSFGFDISTSSSAQDAKQIILDNSFDLIITDINLPGFSGLQLLKWIRQNNISSKTILITGDLNQDNIDIALNLGCQGFLAKPISKKELKKVIFNAISEDEKDKITELDYARIPIDDFLSGNVINFPIYIRFKDNRFLKVAHSGTKIDLNKLLDLKNKGVDELWIQSEDLEPYIELANKIAKYSKTSPNWTNEKKLKLLKHASDLAFENLRLIGVSYSSISEGLKSLKKMFNQLTLLKFTEPLVSNLNMGPNTLYSNAVVVSVWCGLVVNVFSWSNKQNIYNLLIGAYLRDIGLIDFYKKYGVQDISEMSDDQVKEYKAHPNRSKEMLEEVGNIPSEVIEIVHQHHECGQGIGYPQGIDFIKVFPMAKIVLIVENFIIECHDNKLKNNGKLNTKEVITKVSSYYPNEPTTKAIISIIKTKTIVEARRDFAKKKISS